MSIIDLLNHQCNDTIISLATQNQGTDIKIIPLSVLESKIWIKMCLALRWGYAKNYPQGCCIPKVYCGHLIYLFPIIYGIEKIVGHTLVWGMCMVFLQKCSIKQDYHLCFFLLLVLSNGIVYYRFAKL